MRLPWQRLYKRLRIVVFKAKTLFFNQDFYARWGVLTIVGLNMTSEVFSFKIKMLDLSRSVSFHGYHTQLTKPIGDVSVFYL